MINIGIDVHKKKCVATIKRRDSSRILEQLTFYNNTAGIDDFIKHVKDTVRAVCESVG